MINSGTLAVLLLANSLTSATLAQGVGDPTKPNSIPPTSVPGRTPKPTPAPSAAPAAPAQQPLPQAPTSPPSSHGEADPASEEVPSTSLSWCEVLEQKPNPAVVKDPEFVKRIAATGLPWRVRDTTSGIEFLLVPPGDFKMGKSKGDTAAEQDELPAHTVTISKPFYLGKTEVTQEQWIQIMTDNPSSSTHQSPREEQIERAVKNGSTVPEATASAESAPNEREPFPVENTSHDLCKEFCAKSDLRLPTEAEWEYACRAGSEPPKSNELSKFAWFALDSSTQGSSTRTTHAVGTKSPNKLGFYDMLGNVYEWCSDGYSSTFYATCDMGVTDPNAPFDESHDGIVVRGGAWNSDQTSCRASNRARLNPNRAGSNVGFRAARSP